MYTTFDLKDIKSSLSFDVDAVMDIGDAVISLDGQYSLDGNFSLDASFSQHGFDGLSGNFSHLYSTNLTKPGLDIQIGTAALKISGNSSTT
jgi:hypothetical protein